ncbi:MAG: hypothetical protein HRU75_10015 [Planctomycetia bacterium]|nr:MAG: hypothetical protein HRU75_10015 [Planctomycetia bacterium]
MTVIRLSPSIRLVAARVEPSSAHPVSRKNNAIENRLTRHPAPLSPGCEQRRMHEAASQMARPVAGPTAAPAHTPRSTLVYIAGIALLLTAIASSMTMALGHLNAITVPGCGKGSACDQAAGGPFGKIPLGFTAWPTSFAGVAAFGGLLAAWMACRQGVPPALRVLLRIGAVGSLLLLAVMIHGGYLCKYCVVVHACNLALVAMVELLSERAAVRAALPLAIGGFVVATTALAVAESTTQGRFTREQTAAFEDSLERLRERVSNPGAQSPWQEPQTPGATGDGGTSPISDPGSMPIGLPDSVPIGLPDPPTPPSDGADLPRTGTSDQNP